MIKKITKYFVSMLLGLILTTNIAIAEPEIPTYLNLEQFRTIRNSDDMGFLLGLKHVGMTMIHNPNSKRVVKLHIYDMEDLLNVSEKLSCSAQTNRHAVFLKAISESEFVWQELLFDPCNLSMYELPDNWKQTSIVLNDFLQRDVRELVRDWKKEGWEWSQASIYMIVEKSFSYYKGESWYSLLPSALPALETYLAQCHNNIYEMVFAPSTSLCIQKFQYFEREGKR